MKYTFQIFVLSIISLYSGTPPTDTDGNGYRNISTLDHLQYVSENDFMWDYDYELDNDINAGGTESWYNGKGWIPIGNDDVSFSGNFRGNGYTIDSLFINRPDEEYVGFFGNIDTEYNEIRELNIYNSNITGLEYVGVIAGYAESTIIQKCNTSGNITANDESGGLIGRGYRTSVINSSSDCYIMDSFGSGGIAGRINVSNIINCYSTGSIDNGNNNLAGGIVGSNTESLIKNCKAAVDIEGRDFIGGLVGSMRDAGRVINSISFGSVSGSDSVGGLIGYNASNQSYSVENSFWDTEESGQDESDGGIGMTTSQLQIKSTFTDVGWNFEFIWKIDSDYPYIDLDMSYRPEDTNDNGYLNIQTLSELRWVSESYYELRSNLELDNDIDASDTENWNDGKGWTPIGGVDRLRFEGKFNGNNNVIKNLYSKRYDNDKYIGFFGSISTENTEVKNLGIVDCDISGDRYVGGLAGSITSDVNVENCFSTGSISGIMYLGGLVGSLASSSVISESYSECDVSGFVSFQKYIGGLVGQSNYSSVENCYATGNISGSEYIGGLIGVNRYGELVNSYSTGSASGYNYVGGLIGGNGFADVFDSFWDTESSGNPDSDEGYPRNTEEMKTDTTFTNHSWDFDSTWSIHQNINNGYPHLQDLSSEEDLQSKLTLYLHYSGYFDFTSHLPLPVSIEFREGNELMESEINSVKTAIVDEDGTVELIFNDVPEGDYWLLVRANGFLPVCTPDKVSITESSDISHDFTLTSDNSIAGDIGMYEENGIWIIRPADFNMDRGIDALDINLFISNYGKSVSSEIPSLEIESNSEIEYETQKLVNLTISFYDLQENNLYYPVPVMIELRDGDELSESSLISRKSALLNNDGSVSADFGDVPDGDYRILVRSGSFLPVCTPDKHTLSDSGINYDFTTSAEQSVLGERAMVKEDGIWHIRTGDIDADLSIGAYDINLFIPNIGKSVSSKIPALEINGD